MPQLSNDEQHQVVGMLRGGAAVRGVATVYGLLRRYQTTGQRTRVYRSQGERFCDDYVLEGSVRRFLILVWGATI